MKRRFIPAMLLLAIMVAAQPLIAEIIDRIVVVIDESFLITLSDVRKERAIQKAFGDNSGDDDSIIKSLIERHLVEEQIALFREIEIEEDAINERLRGIQPVAGMSAGDLRDTVRADLRRREFLIQRFFPFIQVSDEELRKYYEDEFVPALRQKGQPIPTVERGMLEVRPILLGEKMNKEVGKWLDELGRRTSVEKILK